MTKDKIPYLIIIILVVVCTFLYFRGNHKQTDIDVSKHKIDSLQKEINYIQIINDSIHQDILAAYAENEWYNDQIINLKKQLSNEKHKTQDMVDRVDAWSDNDLRWFFTNRYKGLVTDSVINASSKTSSKGSH